MYRILLMFTLSVIFISCEKELDIQPNGASELLVVDASIESGQRPTVILTNSLDYFKTLSVEDLFNSFVSGAKVTISDGTTTQQLREYIIPAGTGKVIIYSTDSSLGSAQLTGNIKTAYQLTIEAGGKSYTAATTIPDTARHLDSIWWEQAPNNSDTSKVVLFGKVTDPKGLGNYVRYYTKRNDSAFLPGLTSVFDDAFIDGTTYITQVDAGVDRNQSLNFDEYGFFARGDTISLKLSNIDKPTFDFWRTWEQNQSNIGNPFSVPVKVLGNISDGALGYFGGYAVQVKTLIVPKN
jgi:hypothetical protein